MSAPNPVTKEADEAVRRRPFVYLLLFSGFMITMPRLANRYDGTWEWVFLGLFLVGLALPLFIFVQSIRLKSIMNEKGYEWVSLLDAYVLIVHLRRKRHYIPDRESYMLLPGARDCDLPTLIAIARQMSVDDLVAAELRKKDKA
ncbi:hypothetical protein KQI84_14955 [bacterium]|nr:hypothetical protein [bacterium]